MRKTCFQEKMLTGTTNMGLRLPDLLSCVILVSLKNHLSTKKDSNKASVKFHWTFKYLHRKLKQGPKDLDQLFAQCLQTI